jgi:hypothetical protein
MNDATPTLVPACVPLCTMHKLHTTQCAIKRTYLRHVLYPQSERRTNWSGDRMLWVLHKQSREWWSSSILLVDTVKRWLCLFAHFILHRVSYNYVTNTGTASHRPQVSLLLSPTATLLLRISHWICVCELIWPKEDTIRAVLAHAISGTRSSEKIIRRYFSLKCFTILQWCFTFYSKLFFLL